ncbi:MAG TPA: phytanoyl-CoA dioxygenase family protein [Actinocrinis sp.]|nr:phytanoyl-CoA dioxygenase family protein [Actinocrinis sp.]
MDGLVDSWALAGDPAALRARLASDGYLFLRGLLPAEPVAEAGARVRTILKTGGWTEQAKPPPSVPSRRAALAGGVRDAALLTAMACRPFNRIPYLPPLRELVRDLLGPQAFSYPVKVLRTVHPETPGDVPQGRHIHQDYGAASVDDMLTTWVPLMPIPRRVGGLAVHPGSHRRWPRVPRLLSPDERGWATTDYQVGDVLLFHCLTAHAALPNRSDSLRLSQDSRWQPADLPAPARMVYGPNPRARSAERELFSRLLSREPWWEPIPSHVAVLDDNAMMGNRPHSRLFRVHPTWALYRRTPEPVH